METEKRLIDASALLSKAVLANVPRESFPTWLDTISVVKMFDIFTAPTVDAVEVVHSQWDTVFYESHGTLATYSHLCPVCKYFYKDVRCKGHNYCPSCGAKMDGERRADGG